METLVLTTNQEITFTNPQLKKATKALMTIGAKLAKCSIEAAIVAAGVSRTECYKEDGFNTAAEWLKKTFSMSTASAYNLIRVGNEYINSETKETVLPHTNKDFTVSQVIAMLPLNDVEQAQEMVEAGEITVDMSVRDIKKIVADTIKIEETKETEETEETDEHLWNNAEQAISELIAYYVNDNPQLCQKLSEVYNILENLNPTHI